MPNRSLLQVMISQIRVGLTQVLQDKVLLLFDIFGTMSIAFTMQIILWTSAYTGTSALEHKTNQTLQDLLLYYGFTFGLSRLNNAYLVIENMSTLIISGKLDSHLMKPTSYFQRSFFMFMGESLPYLTLIVVTSILTWIIQHPFNFWQLSTYALILMFTLFLSQLLCFQIGFMLSLGTARLEKTETVLALYSVLAALFGGVLLPPHLWPEAFQPLMTYNPFGIFMAGLSKYIVAPDIRIAGVLILSLTTWIAVLYGLYLVQWRLFLLKYRGVGG